MAAGMREGWEPTVWDGTQQGIDLLAQKHIKVIISGGALNPRGQAQKCQQLVGTTFFRMPCNLTHQLVCP
jgi:hypothetical protein